MKQTVGAVSALALLVVFGLPAISFAAPVEKTDGFVCPVLNEHVGAHNPNAFAIAGGDYSLIPSGTPHTISIPTHATNDNGAGSPGGDHATPGKDYTAIWASN